MQTHDYCIIGSGIGGSTLALKLVEQGKNVLIIEAGKKYGNSKNVTYENTGREFGLRATTSIQLGGTSNIWHGVLSLLDPIDFEKREWIQHSGWPITYQELLPFYKESSKIYSVKEYNYFSPESLNSVLKSELNKIDFDREIFYNKLFQQPLPTVRFKRKLVKLCKGNKNIQVLINSTALEIITCDNGKRVKAIKVADSTGTLKKIAANNFILAAGALETPRLLLNSNKNSNNGIGNNNIGRYLMDHPMGNLLQIQFITPQKARLYSDTKYDPKSKIKTGLLLKESLQKKKNAPNHCFYLKPSFIHGIDDKSEKIKLAMLTFLSGKLNLKDIYNVVTNFNVVMQILAYKFTLNLNYKYADLFFITEQIPNPNSCVTLSNKKDKFGYPIANINWQVTEDEINSVHEWYSLIKEAFPSSKYNFTHSYNNIDWNNIYTSAAHHVGTARMASNSQNGVVDKNLRVFDVENLYICDGSVFPTSGNVNSGFTISALACKLADHLKKI
jgi:choline dehydrogenase-like flavoprotein